MRILGVDLASRSWADVGFAVLTLGHGRRRVALRPFAPSGPLTAAGIAAAIDAYARREGIAVVSIDGPHAWRAADAGGRRGVGRASELAARTQGKTGAFGKTYPQTQHGWIAFSIEVFDRLLALEGVDLAEDTRKSLAPKPRGYWLMECFPTQTWRSLGLQPLPGKARCDAEDVASYAETLWSAADLAMPIPTMTHDELQAVVACLPAAAALEGSERARAYGLPSFIEPGDGQHVPPHRAEGFIWDVAPRANRPARAASP